MTRLTAPTKSLTLILILALSVAVRAEELPAVSITNVRRLTNDLNHNAFTDLIWFRGHIYLTYRSCPDGHSVFDTSSIVVKRSADGTEWETVNNFSVSGRDVRDPHLVVFKDKLYLYTGTWYCGPHKPKIRNMNQMLGYGTSTLDGKTWSEPFPLEGTYGNYVWKAHSWDGRVYLCARRRKEYQEVTDYAEHTPIVQSRLLTSTDGKRFVDYLTVQTEYGDEFDFIQDKDGGITFLARQGGRRNALLLTANSSRNKVSSQPLGRYLGGPLLFDFMRWRLVAGRNINDGQPQLVVSVLAAGKLHDLVTLPSGGDCSYPGMVALCPGCILVSWYSSHEGSTEIYTAKLHFN